MNKKLALCVVGCVLWVATACINRDPCMEIDCVDGELTCIGNDVYVCAASNWDIKTACENNSICNERTFVCDAPVFVCKGGDKRCSDNDVEICVYNAWDIDTRCSTRQICNPVNYSCDIACDDGAAACTKDGKLERCVNGLWIKSDCKVGEVCPSGKTACQAAI